MYHMMVKEGRCRQCLSSLPPSVLPSEEGLPRVVWIEKVTSHGEEADDTLVPWGGEADDTLVPWGGEADDTLVPWGERQMTHWYHGGRGR